MEFLKHSLVSKDYAKLGYIIMSMFLLLTIQACKKQELPETDSQLISRAQEWFQKQHVTNYKPSWDKAKVIMVNNNSYVLLPSNLLYAKEVSSYLLVNLSSRDIIGNLVEVVNSSSENSQSFIEAMCIYTNGTEKHQLSVNGSYNLLVFDIKHKFIKGAAFSNGKIIGDINLVQPKDTRTQNATMAIDHEKINCTHWYWVVYDINTGEIYSATYLYSVCTEEGGSGGGAGGNSGGEQIGDIITADTSITNNPKIKCLLEKLLGANGNVANPQFMAMLNAFKNKGFDVTFKIGNTVDANSKAETSPDPFNPTKYNIVFNRTKINTESQMGLVKTMLHEAFHASLLQRCYELYGSATVGLWQLSPNKLTLEELMDKVFDFTSGNSTLASQHHEFMAENFQIIRNGLASFSWANNSNHSSFTSEYFDALAYEGLHETSYYLNKVVKDVNGNDIMVSYNGGIYTLKAVHTNRAGSLEVGSTIPCN